MNQLADYLAKRLEDACFPKLYVCFIFHFLFWPLFRLLLASVCFLFFSFFFLFCPIKISFCFALKYSSSFLHVFYAIK